MTVRTLGLTSHYLPITGYGLRVTKCQLFLIRINYPEAKKRYAFQ